MLHRNLRICGKERGLPAMAGEEQNLAVPGSLLQPPERGSAACVIEVGQRVVQNDGNTGFLRQNQLANGQPGSQIQLIRCSGGEKLNVPVDGITFGSGSEAEAAIQRGGGVTPTGKLLKNFGGSAAQLGEKRFCRVVLAPVRVSMARRRASYSVSSCAICDCRRSAAD